MTPTLILVLVGVVFATVIYFYYFYNSKIKLKPMVISTSGTVRPDDEVIIMPRPLVVNIVYESAKDYDQGMVADLVINYKDLLSGKYNAVKSQEIKTESLTKQEVGVNDSAVEPGPGPEVKKEEVDLSNEPEVEEGREEEIPEPEEEDSATGFTPVDLTNMNFNF